MPDGKSGCGAEHRVAQGTLDLTANNRGSTRLSSPRKNFSSLYQMRLTPSRTVFTRNLVRI